MRTEIMVRRIIEYCIREAEAGGLDREDNLESGVREIMRVIEAQAELTKLASNMTLRDYFAGQALAGILASYSNKDNIVSSDICAKEAYKRADAMMKERER